MRLDGWGLSPAWTAVSGDGTFALPAPRRGRFRLRASLDNARWTFRRPNDDGAYEWETGPFQGSPAGIAAGDLVPARGEHAKAGALHLTFLDALDFLAREAGVEWWTVPVGVEWPSEKDFYWSVDKTLRLSDAHGWDTALHELGHAVMDLALPAKVGGGEHYVDRCYDAGLAWSEGWATFFAGAVGLSPDDPDARFEFLVPRLSSVGLENVPAWVCPGPTNEWRVAAGLWDLHDRHADGGDAAVVPFRTLWDAARSGPTAGLADLWGLLGPRLDPGLRRLTEAALAHNTLVPAPQPLVRTPRLPAPGPGLFEARPR